MADLTSAAASGDRRATLEALRDLLAGSLVDADPQARAPLAKQLRDTLDQLAALDRTGEVSASDDLAQRRAARLGGSAAQG